MLSEIAEVSTALLDSKVTAALNKYADLIDYIHFSDQFSGPKQTEWVKVINKLNIIYEYFENLFQSTFIFVPAMFCFRC